MKKTLPLIIICILIITSCSNLIDSSKKDDFQLYEEEVYEDLIINIKNLKLPEFTAEEKEQINYYRTNPLKVGQFNHEYYYANIDDSIVGVNYYAILLLEELLDIKTEVFEIDYLNFQEDLKTGYCDIVTGIYSNIAEENLSVTKPYAFDKIFVYSKNNLKITDIEDLEDLEGLKIGITNNLKYVKDRDIDYLLDLGLNPEIKRYENNAEAIVGYDNGEIDIIVDTISPTLMQNKFYINLINANVFAKKLKLGYNKEILDENFVSVIDKIFDNYEVKENIRLAERRSYQAFLNKGLLFTEEENAYIEKTKKNPIKLKSIQFLNPISYISKDNNEYNGAVVEVWKRVSQISGLRYETIINLGENYKSMFKEVEEGLIDGSMIKIYNISDEKYLYTDPIFESKFVLVGSEKSPYINKTNNLNNYDIGVINNTVASKYIHEKVSKDNIIDRYNNTVELVKGLNDEEVDFIVINDYLFNKLYYEDKKYELTHISDLDYSGDLISIFNKDNKDNELIVSIFNKSLYGIELEVLETEYLNTRINIGMLLKTVKFNIYIIYVAFSIIFFIGALLLIQWKRKYKLADKISKIDILTNTNNRYCLKQDYINGFSNDKIIFYIDLNNFKSFNDVYGHKTGDFVLTQYVKQLKLISNNKIYRFGGDEFILVLSNDFFSEQDLLDCIHKCSESIIEDKENNTVHKIKASIGVVNLNIFEEKIKNYTYILSLADFTMYLAKKDKKNNYKICDEYIIQIQKSMHTIETKMDKPLGDTGLIPYFQPIFDLYDNIIVGFETLARWKDGDSIIYPDEFIPILEKMGNIHTLDLFMLEKSLCTFEKWYNEGLIDKSMYITSNFSGSTLLSISIDDINAVYERHNVSKKNFVIEITESFFIEENAMGLVLELKENGYKIAIDDFSAGHSSLNSLVKIDMDFTKIDKNLVYNSKIPEHHIKGKSKIVLRNVIKLVNELESDIIVEGIEDEETIQLFKELGNVRKVQGYYFSKPISEVAMRELIIKVNKS